MASVQMPQSVPCIFDNNWAGKCRKPSDNGWCSDHENAKCRSCGKHAVRSCDEGMGGLACGAKLCADCQHLPEDGSHVTEDVYRVWRQEQDEFEQHGKESKRMLAKRGIPAELDLPDNLEVLLGGPHEGYVYVDCFTLELAHGLMGYFPALVKDKAIIVTTTDRESIFRVWESLAPKDSKVVKNGWMVNATIGIGYQTVGDSEDRKRSFPHLVFSKDQIDAMFVKDGHPFEWARGLLGVGMEADRFRWLIDRARQAA